MESYIHKMFVKGSQSPHVAPDTSSDLHGLVFIFAWSIISDHAYK